MLYPRRGPSVGFPACFVPPRAACVPMRSHLSVQATVHTLSLCAAVRELSQAYTCVRVRDKEGFF